MNKNLKRWFLKIIVAHLFLSLPSYISADYLWPFKERAHLTGSFGEFRKNHIHAGIDISTHGKIGLPVYAGESGILYRVKIQYIGFGKTIYLKLPDGRFLVYAHLDRFNPKIKEAIKAAQLKQNKFAVDIYPKSKIHISKGELIGYSGDSGGVAPHLHMELRDPKERPINILKNGLSVPDKTPPIIQELAICNPEDTFVIAKATSPIYVSGKVGLAVSVYDESRGNKLGIYQIDLIVDGKLFFRVKLDSFSYEEFYDNFLVYNKDLYVNHNKIYYHLFRTFNNPLPFYPLNTNGILDLTPGKHPIIIKAMDHQGNTSTLNATIIAKPKAIYPLPTGERASVARVRGSDDGKLCVELEGLYSPTDIKIRTLSIKPKLKELVPVSKVYEITPKAAVFKKAHITIKAPSDSKKFALYRFDNGKWKYMDNNTCRTFTRFCLFKDTTPPTIQVISPLRAKIEDKGSGLDYDKLALYIDGKKVIAEYSVNRKELFYKGQLPPGKHKITWVAVDRMGNETIIGSSPVRLLL